MPNAFDRSEYPTREPAELVIGDRWTWRKSLSDFPPASYTLTYEARSHAATPDRFTLTATNDGTDHLVETAATATVAFESGTYDWTAFISRNSDSERFALASGVWEVKPDPATDNSDPRTFAKRALDAIESVMEGRADRQILSGYTIGDRSLQFATLDELIKARNYYRAEHRQQQQAARVARGLSPNTTVGIRF